MASLKKSHCGCIFLLTIVFVVGLLSMPQEEYLADPMAVRCETVSLINNGSLDVPVHVAVTFGERGQFFVENVTKQKWYCKYGILNSLLYVPVLAIQKWREGSLDYFSLSRVIYLNLFNLLLSLASAVYLYLIAAKFTRRSLVSLLFVLTAFYSTYWWNYLRAHNSEIYQTLFMLGFYYHLTARSKTSDALGLKPIASSSSINFLFAGVFFGALILVKSVYVVLLPLIGLFLFVTELDCYRKEHGHSMEKISQFSLRSFLWFSFPLALTFLFLLFINNYKFGSPFECGYGQWKERGQPIFSGHFFSGLKNFLFNIQYSIFVYFPILVFAFFGYPYFLKKYRLETGLFLSLGLVLLLVNSKLLTWSGGWAYGPRYLLVMLPLVSLPFVHTLDKLIDQRKKIWAMVCMATVALVLCYSFQLQRNVNALPFFVYFRLEGLLKQLHDPEIDHYLSSRPFGVINGDLLVFKKGGRLKILDLASRELPPASIAELATIISRLSPSNYYLWPDRPMNKLTSPK